MVQALRDAKHRAHLLVHPWRVRTFPARLRVLERTGLPPALPTRYRYPAGGYPGTFLDRDVVPAQASPGVAPAVLWAIWLGGEPTPRRRESLAAMERQDGLELRLVRGPGDVEVPGAPVHPGLALLHPVHRSDYLRAYLLHHHGGIYGDVKPFRHALHPALGLLERPGTELVGYPEVGSLNVTHLPGRLGRDLRRHHRAVPGTSAFAARPGSRLTSAWMTELHARLDAALPALERANAATANSYDPPPGYPFAWSDLLGGILQPLALKHRTAVRLTGRLRPRLYDYR